VELEQERRRFEAERIAKERELEHAKALAEAQRQRADVQAAASIRLRRFSWALFTLLALAAGTAFYGWQQRGAAEGQGRLALSRQLAAQAVSEIGRAQRLALLVAVAADRTAPVQEARHSLQKVLMAQPQLTIFLSRHQDKVWSVAFSPDGSSPIAAIRIV
jgi:hypothetical protein